MTLIQGFCRIFALLYFIFLQNFVQPTEAMHDFYKLSSGRLNEHMEIKKYGDLFLKMFLNSDCVEIESKYNSEMKLNAVVENLFALNFTVVLNRNPGDGFCQSVLVLVGEDAFHFQEDFQQKSDKRGTVVMIVDSEEIHSWLLDQASPDEIFDIFGFADSFFIFNSSVYQLSSPSSVNRYFSVITLETMRLFESRSTKLPNFEQKSLRVATFDCPVNVFVKTVNNQSVIDDGLEYTIFEEIARRLNFTYDVTLLDDENNKWGVLLENGSWNGGIIGKILSSQQQHRRAERVDIGFCGVWQIYPQSLFVDLTVSLVQEKNRFLVRKQPELRWCWLSPFTEFQFTVWLCIGAVFSVQVFVLYTTAQISKQCPLLRLKRYFRLSSCLLEVLGIHLQSCSPSWKRKSAYLLMIQFYSLVITTSYTSYILNRLLTPHVTEGVTSIQELIEGPYYWGKPYPASRSIINYKSEHLPFIKRRRLLSKEHIDRLIGYDDNFALVVGTIMDRLIKTDISVNVTLLQQRRYLAVPDDLQLYSIAFALRKHSPYTATLDRLIARIASSGLLTHWINELAAKHKNEVLKMRIRDFYDTNSFKALTLQNLKGVIALLLIGLSLASCALILELLLYNRNQH